MVEVVKRSRRVSDAIRVNHVHRFNDDDAPFGQDILGDRPQYTDALEQPSKRKYLV